MTVILRTVLGTTLAWDGTPRGASSLDDFMMELMAARPHLKCRTVWPPPAGTTMYVHTAYIVEWEEEATGPTWGYRLVYHNAYSIGPIYEMKVPAGGPVALVPELGVKLPLGLVKWQVNTGPGWEDVTAPFKYIPGS